MQKLTVPTRSWVLLHPPSDNTPITWIDALHGCFTNGDGNLSQRLLYLIPGLGRAWLDLETSIPRLHNAEKEFNRLAADRLPESLYIQWHGAQVVDLGCGSGAKGRC